MARAVAELPPGARITDYICLGVITKTFPLSTIGPVLSNTGKASLSQRDPPAQAVVYYVIALALYMQSSYREILHCLLEAVQWLRDPRPDARSRSQSRRRPRSALVPPRRARDPAQNGCLWSYSHLRRAGIFIKRSSTRSWTSASYPAAIAAGSSAR